MMPVILILACFHIGPREVIDNGTGSHLADKLHRPLDFDVLNFIRQPRMDAYDWMFGIDGLRRIGQQTGRSRRKRVQKQNDDEQSKPEKLAMPQPTCATAGKIGVICQRVRSDCADQTLAGIIFKDAVQQKIGCAIEPRTLWEEPQCHAGYLWHRPFREHKAHQ